MNTHHIFNKYVAKELGIENAIILQNMLYWLEKNQANDTNKHDGKYWTYNTTKAYAEIFPYWSERQISYRLNELEKDGIIESGNFNEKGYDRTKWYTITELGFTILQNCQMELTKLSNAIDKSVRPIPDVNTDINTDVNQILTGSEKTTTEEEEKVDIPYKEIIEYLNEKADKRFNFKTEAHRSLIRARFNEGFTLEDFKKVIDNMSTKWLNSSWEYQGKTKRGSDYLKPDTLFRSSNFDKYLNMEVSEESGEEGREDISSRFTV